MKDEIKEINIPENVLVALSDLTNGALNYYKSTEAVKVRHNTILDYITNLQEENEKLKSYIKLTDEEAKEYMYDTNKEIEKLNKEKEDYKQRNEKAIDFMNNTFSISDVKDMFNTMNELENILKGEDE